MPKTTQHPKLADYVAQILAAAPPLTPSQLDKVGNLLRGGAS